MHEKQKYPTAPEKDLKGIVRTNLDSPQPTPAQRARKATFMARVKEMGLPTIEHLPVIEDEGKIRSRTPEEVARRCVATTFCAVRAEAPDLSLVGKLVKDYDADSYFTPQESRFIRDANPSQTDRANFSWRYECCHVFLWALGHLDQLKQPGEVCDVSSDAQKMRSISPKEWIAKARLRSMSEILDMADFYYRLHWAAIDLRLKGKTSNVVHEGVILERHRALNWLIRYMNQEWDDVQTDT